MSRKREDYENEQFCGYCGERLPDIANGSCPGCKRRFGRRVLFRRPPPPPIEYGDEIYHRRPYTRDPGFRDPVLAALLSAVLPGAGQVYNYQFLKGLLILLTCWLIIPYFLGIFDAYMSAEHANRWQTVGVRAGDRHRSNGF